MRKIELFYGPLDGLVLDDELIFSDKLAFPYIAVGKNHKLEHEPSSVIASAPREVYERTETESENEHKIFTWNQPESIQPKGTI